MIIKSGQLACRDRKDLPLQLCDFRITEKADANGAFQFEGYGSVWDRVDSYGDTVLEGAFVDSLKERQPMMLYGHAMNRIPGKWLTASEDKRGLRLKGELTPGHSEAKDLEASLRHGAISGLSIGGYTSEADWIEQDGMLVGRKIKKFDLYEVSVVGMPAETEARVDATSIKSALAECATIREVETMLREQHGFSRQAAEALVGRVRALAQGDPADGAATKGVADLRRTIEGLKFPKSLLGAIAP
jgi:HK97 family phage prohead protease